MRIFAGFSRAVSTMLMHRLRQSCLTAGVCALVCGTTATQAAEAVSTLRTVPQYTTGLVYPAEMLAAGQGAVVVTRLRIAANGAWLATHEVTSRPTNPALEQAVRASVPAWTYQPRLDSTCKPVDADAEMVLRFAVEQGQPVIEINRGYDMADRIKQFDPLPDNEKIGARLMSSYPAQARRWGVEAEVHLLTDVHSATGIPLKQEVVGVKLSNDRQDDVLARQFADAALKTLQRMQLAKLEDAKPKLPSGGPVYPHCMSIQFKLAN